MYDGKNNHEMYAYLTDSLKSFGLFISGHTPFLDSGNRVEEIKRWIENNNNGEIIRYVILDDDYPYEEYEKQNLHEHLIKTSFWDGGLNREHVERAIVILNRKEINNENAN